MCAPLPPPGPGLPPPGPSAPLHLTGAPLPLRLAFVPHSHCDIFLLSFTAVNKRDGWQGVNLQLSTEHRCAGYFPLSSGSCFGALSVLVLAAGLQCSNRHGDPLTAWPQPSCADASLQSPGGSRGPQVRLAGRTLAARRAAEPPTAHSRGLSRPLKGPGRGCFP